MFCDVYSKHVDSLVNKLRKFGTTSTDMIDLLHVLSCMEGGVHTHSLPYFLPLSSLEKHLLKGALPLCLSRANVQETNIAAVEQWNDEKNNNNDDDVNLQPHVIRSLKRYSAPKKPTCLTGTSVEVNPYLHPVTLCGVNSTSDIKTPPRLIISCKELQKVLMSLPPWSIWNKLTDKEKKVGVFESMLRALTSPTPWNSPNLHPCREKHKNCKFTSEDFPQTCQSIYHPPSKKERGGEKRRRPRAIRKSQERPKDDPLAILRTYCKHFHAGGWIQEYDKLVEDLMECTFQPNIHKYQVSPKEVLSEDPKENVEDVFDAFKVALEKEKVLIPQHLPLSQRCRTEPKYAGIGSRYHHRCLESTLPSTSHRHSRRNHRRKPWEETLREESHREEYKASSNVPTCYRRLDPQKENRYYNYDWGKYIRMTGRHLMPVCVPNRTLCRKLLKEAQPPWKAEHPQPTLVEWSGGGHPRGAIFLAKTSVEDYKVNYSRNWCSLLEYGMALKELHTPVKVLGIETDPVEDLELRVIEAKPSTTGLVQELQELMNFYNER